MRSDPSGSQLINRRREPRIVVAIIYPTGSIYLTNRTGIANVPGNVVHGVLTDISSSSQELQPDDARTTIGRLSFTALDLDGDVTDEIRSQLNEADPRGINRREVRVFTGDTDDFDDGTWRRVETYVIDSSVELTGRSYRFHCLDRSREQRLDIFEQKQTRLSATLTATDTTVTVIDTSDFELVEHTASFTDAPSAEVGYIRIKKTGEIIRYTGKTSTTFTGCTRGVFGTTAQAVDDINDDNEKKPEVDEFIYLEMPGPELVYAVMTGVIKSTDDTLPDHWHMGIDESYIDGDQFDNIGADLYDPNDVTAGLVFRFTHLEKTDGKKFVEEQLHFPMGTFAPISAEGVLGLRRMVSLISTARPDAILFRNNVIEHGTVSHVQSRIINQAVVHWNFDGERYTRTDLLINAASIAAHGKSKPREIKLRGLHVSRHDRQVLRNIFATITDRYGAPPIEVDMKLSRSMNRVEIGDTVRTVLERVRDYTAQAYLDRTFEVQRRSINWRTGDLSVKLFGSTARLTDNPDDSITDAPLADAWYTATGTELSTVLTISSDVVTANGTLSGGSDLRTAVFYYDGDLTINAGVTVTIEDNVQLRVRGTLTINGAIDGAGNGISGLSDPNTIGFPMEAYPTTQQTSFIGATQGSDTIRRIVATHSSYPSPLQRGVNSAAPRLNLVVDGSGNLLGIPAELRGTRGGYGAPVIDGDYSSEEVAELGGAGGAGGAGLMIVCRGLSFGVSGEIDLSGADGSAPASSVVVGGRELYGGAGAGGAPGALYVILDGNTITYPDLTGSFIAEQGFCPQTGNPLEGTQTNPTVPATGQFAGMPVVDYWSASHFVQYVPQELVTGEGDDELVPAPKNLTEDSDGAGVLLSWALPPANRYDYVELFQSIDNDRSNAVQVYKGRSSSFFQSNASEVTRYYWIRAVDEGVGVSEWEPVSSTGGIDATFGGATGPQGDPGADGDDGADAISVAITTDNGVQFRQAVNGGAWTPASTTTDITFTFYQGGSSIATHVVRVTRSGANLSAATQSESGDATTEAIIGGGTPVVTIIVTHNASNISAAQSVSAVVSGNDGADGAQGTPGADGADGEDAPLLRWVGSDSWPVSTTIASADEYPFTTTLDGADCIILVRATDAEGGVRVGLNGTELGVMSGANNETRWYTFAAEALLVSGTNVVQVWSTTADGGSISAIEVVHVPVGSKLSGLITLSDALGSVTVSQMTANVLAALQANVASLTAITAELGSAVITSTGFIRSGSSGYNTGDGWFIGRDGGEPALSIRAGNQYLTYKPSEGLVIRGNISETPAHDGGTFTGFTTSPSINASLYKVGSRVTCVFNSGVNGTSNSTGFATTAFIPSELRPSAAQVMPAYGFIDNSTSQLLGYIQVNTNGTMTFNLLTVSGSYVRHSSWAPGGNKGLAAGMRVEWSI